MQGGKLDFYTAEYKQLARLAEYNLEERLVGKKYFEGLPEGLRRAIVKDENMNLLTTVADYEDAAIRYHRKFLQYQTFFERPSKEPQKAELNSSGNNVLPKTTMPWTLPLDVSVPGLPCQKTRWPSCAERANASNASAKDT
jgi:hypothetical protein